MKKNLTLISLVLGVMLLVSVSGIVSALDSFPSTNEDNMDGTNSFRPGVIGPHVNLVSAENGEITLEFVMPENYNAVFEVRIDDAAPGSTPHDGAVYPWLANDEYYYEPLVVVNGGSVTHTYSADEKVAVRNAAGAESDWYFDWVSFYLPCEVTVNPPVSGWYNANPMDIEWEYTGYCELQADQDVNLAQNSAVLYRLFNFGDTYTREATWTPDTEGTGFSICLDTELEGQGNEAEGCSAEFNVDLTDPIADANGETCWCGDEFYCPSPQVKCPEGCCQSQCEQDVYTCYEGHDITLDGSNSDDLLSGIVSWEWYVDGELVDYCDTDSATCVYSCLDGDYTLDLELVVTDAAGNSDSDDDSEIDVINVDPVCTAIQASMSNVPLINGEADVDFEAFATDVAADIPLNYLWSFGDGDTLNNGEIVSHTYTEADTYEVSVVVSDKNGGMTTCPSIFVDVVEPISLDDQEVAAYYPLMADFGDDAGDAGAIPYGVLAGLNPSFETGLTSLNWNDCEVLIGPTNLVTYSVADGECRVRWDNDEPPHHGLTENPTNDQQGTHQVVIKVDNGTDINYYEFYVTVYSWIIDLEAGWNLISIPYISDDTSIESVILDQLGEDGQDILPGRSEYAVWSYQYTGEESEWLKSRASGYGDLNTVVPGYAYWIKTTAAGKLRGFGTQIAQTGDFPGLPPEVEVPTNSWSLIGRYGILGENNHPQYAWYHYPGEDPWDAGAVSKNVALETLTKLDNELHVFEVTEDAHLNEVQKLWNNQGYWLWIEDEALNNAGTETYAPLDKYYMEDLFVCGHHNCRPN